MTEIFVIKHPGKTIVEINESGISITRKGIINAINIGLTGGKTIPFSSITAVQFKKAGMTNGYIQFSILGGKEQKGGVVAATKDENTIMFSKKYEKIAMNLKEIVDNQINKNSREITNKQQTNSLEQLKTLKELLDSEIILKKNSIIKKSYF